MLLEYQEEVNSEEGWLYEPKFDGIRLLVGSDYSYTRHGTITTSRFPELLLGKHADTLLDGELIAQGTNSPDDFSGAMSRFSGNKDQPILYMAFDILTHKGESIMYHPIEERKELLSDVVSTIDSPYIKLMPYVSDGEALFDVIKENKMEGIIAKRLGTPYLNGTRSDNWRKIINWSYHDVIVSKITFKPLSVQLSNVDGEYVGGTTIGFTKEIRSKLNTMTPPFSVKVKSRGWTSGGKLRLPQIIEVK